MAKNEQSFIIPNRAGKEWSKVTINLKNATDFVATIICPGFIDNLRTYASLVDASANQLIELAEESFDEMIKVNPGLALGVLAWGFGHATLPNREHQTVDMLTRKMFDDSDLKINANSMPHTAKLYNQVVSWSI